MAHSCAECLEGKTPTRHESDLINEDNWLEPVVVMNSCCPIKMGLFEFC